ncbi:MAG TPA: SDR family oxidoreductase [Tepidisphaeraceae bacterium]|jgi:NAD(P)-dependent dehydrogenase (short-subunit alcohol dehydrogenase family)|nr:SDR family oxidoreductase [Tepidisphaeraceae bacterium]
MDAPVAIVTGAGKGIGRACAQLLGSRGYRVVLLARTKQNLDETARGIADHLVIPTDVSKSDQVDRAVKMTIDQFGRIDVVINAAGLAPILKIEETTNEQWRDVIDTNLSSAFYACRAAWPHLKKNGGAIVNISSAAARDPFAGFTAYGAAKAGVNLLGLSLAREGGEHNIRVHTVAPSAVETEMFRTIVSKDQYPTEKTLSPEDVAKVVVGCITGDLNYTSGEVIWIHKTV